MYYDFAITIPKSTSQGTPVTQVLKLTEGIITYAEIQFPKGTYAKVHCQVLCHEFQIWPLNREGSISADGYVVPISDTYALDEEPYELKFVGWSDADTFSYDINIRIVVQRPEEIEKISPLGKALNKFLKLVGIGG